MSLLVGYKSMPACANSSEKLRPASGAASIISQHPFGTPRAPDPRGGPPRWSLIPLPLLSPPPVSLAQDVVWNDPRPFSRIAPRVTCANRVWLPPLYNASALSALPLHPSHPPCRPSPSVACRPFRYRRFLALLSSIGFFLVSENQSATTADERNCDWRADKRVNIVRCEWRTAEEWSPTEHTNDERTSECVILVEP